VTKWLGGRRTLAALVTTCAIAMLLIGPFVLMGFSVADDAKALGSATRTWVEQGPPAAPAWLGKVPVVGGKATEYWNEMAAEARQLGEKLRMSVAHQAAIRTNSVDEAEVELPAVQPVEGATKAKADTKLLQLAARAIAALQGVAVTAGLAIGRGVFELTLSVFLSFFFFSDGEAAAARLNVALHRIAGLRGQHLLQVAGGTVRGVVYGILGTALVQAVMAGVGFLMAGVPGAMLLGLLTFFLSVVPMGPPLVWIPATIWLFSTGHTGWGVFMIIWGIAVSSVDNVVKPWLISQGSAMPFVLIFFGVLGGALAFGFIGVFLGPTMLAVAYRLMEEWSATPPVAGEEVSDSTVKP
jgi:predicted PurR-regulated permease PerM